MKRLVIKTEKITGIGFRYTLLRTTIFKSFQYILNLSLSVYQSKILCVYMQYAALSAVLNIQNTRTITLVYLLLELWPFEYCK